MKERLQKLSNEIEENVSENNISNQIKDKDDEIDFDDMVEEETIEDADVCLQEYDKQT